MNLGEQKLPLGTVIDHYEIRDILGIGGFGVTYKARDNMLDRWVAIKEFLPSDLAVREQGGTTIHARTDRTEDYRFALDKFLQEARTLAKFDHPNIVRVTRFLEANGTGYLVMDFVEGQSLSDYLKRNGGTVSEEQLKDWFTPILRGLQEVHQTGFLHRDIKPGNIYLRDEGEPLLIDFGAARQAIGEHSRSVTGIVSAGYAPTEQYGTDAKKQGPWTDLYSVGASLYRCISGKDPIDAPTRQSAQFEGDPDPLTPAREIGGRRYSPALLQLIDELLVLPIKQRPQGALPVLTALKAGENLSPDEPRSTVVTQVVTPGREEKGGQQPEPQPERVKARPPEPEPTHAPPPEPAAQGGALKLATIAVIVALLGVVVYLLLGQEEKPTPVATYKPPVSQVRPTGQLILSLAPSNARVVLPDIGPRYRRGMTLNTGSYRVKASAEGYERWEGRVEVSEGDNRYEISLVALLQGPQVGEVFRDKLRVGGAGPELVVLPTGKFRMGCVSGRDCSSNEKPVHEVMISRPIAMMKYEVTFADYDRYAEAAGKQKPSDSNWDRGNRPVINVSWEDALGYARWLSDQTGKRYRLPTEAEWEYAARAGTDIQYSWGDSIGCGQARYGRRESGECSNSPDGTVSVGSFKANAWGLYDMAGNVWEWVEDCYHVGYSGAPRDGSAWEGSCELNGRGTKYRVLRGGSWNYSPGAQRSAFRFWSAPWNRAYSLGFRLVQELNP